MANDRVSGVVAAGRRIDADAVVSAVDPKTTFLTLMDPADLAPEKIQAALENIRRFDIGGLEVNYSLEDHTGLDFADLSIIGTDGKFKR